MRIYASMKWRILAMARMWGYRGDPRLFGVEVPLRLVPSDVIRRQLDAGSYEAKEARFIQEYLPPGSEVLELGASLGVVSSIILGQKPERLISYEAVGPLGDIARQVVAHNYPAAPWELVHCAIAAEGVTEVEELLVDQGLGWRCVNRPAQMLGNGRIESGVPSPVRGEVRCQRDQPVSQYALVRPRDQHADPAGVHV